MEVALASSGVSLPPAGKSGVVQGRGDSAGNGALDLSNFRVSELEGSRLLFSFPFQQPPGTCPGQVLPLLS